MTLKPRPQGRGAHHPIDAFFESLAQDQRERAIGVILSDAATDGTLGLEAIKAEGRTHVRAGRIGQIRFHAS